MPVSLTWTVAQTRAIRRAARASTATMKSGRTVSAAPRTSSADSSPVVASTPVRTAATGRSPENCCGMARSRWRVTSRWSRV